jgi:anthranilate phosphoribosyltransferase
VRVSTVRPEDFGVPRTTIANLQGGDRTQNAEIIRGIQRSNSDPR